MEIKNVKSDLENSADLVESNNHDSISGGCYFGCIDNDIEIDVDFS
ncbi:hypothetical protein [Cellvibrio sp. NN19]|nr:hypothetical protein [Cellvibrio sp. NN19]